MGYRESLTCVKVDGLKVRRAQLVMAGYPDRVTARVPLSGANYVAAVT